MDCLTIVYSKTGYNQRMLTPRLLWNTMAACQAINLRSGTPLVQSWRMTHPSVKWEDPRSFRTPRIARMLPTSHMAQHTAKQISPQLQGIESLPSDDLSSCHSWGTTGSKCGSITLQGKLMAGPQSLIKQQSATQHARTLRESRLRLLLNRV